MRRADWDARLAEHVRASDRPFAWGQNDCALFAGGAVKAMTGLAVVDDWRGRYRTGNGAVRALRRAGHGDAAAAFTAALGEPVALALLRRGDPVQAVDGNLGILWPGGALFVGDAGLIVVPLSDLLHGWRAGHG